MPRLIALLAVAAVVAACGSQPEQVTVEPEASETPTVYAGTLDGNASVAEDPGAGAEPEAGTTTTRAAAAGSDYVQMLAVGDIASCDTGGDEKVAALAARRVGRIALLGDIVYPDATARQFRRCFDPAWGPMAARLRPTPGNHEYHTADADPYWDYFGDWSGTRGRGWYAYNAGPHWRVIVLNSNCGQVGGCGPRSPQGRWLARALDYAGDRHVLAYFHAPRFSSGKHGSNTLVAPFWRALYRARADIVLNGHDHHYERFAPQNPVGERRRYGVQQFIVGTGGYRLYPFGRSPLPNTVVRDNTSFGLLALRLRPHGYSWWFVPSEGGFKDSGNRSLP